VTEPRTIPFGSPIFDPNGVQERITRAQACLLSLHRLQDSEFEKLLRGDRPPEPEANRKPFTKNIIRLDVSGANLVDVTFIDLPGLVANVLMNCRMR
jgi:hypothetical protein